MTRWRIQDQVRKRLPVAVVRKADSDSDAWPAILDHVADPEGSNLEAIWNEEWERNLVNAALEQVKRQVDLKQFQIFDLNVLQNLPAAKVRTLLNVSAGRVIPLGDGDERDRADHLCCNVVGDLPRCMDLISADEVIRRIELYFDGGIIQHLTASQARAAKKGVSATRSNTFDEQPLNLHNARLACETFIKRISEYPGTFEGRGIVICGGGIKYFTNAWVNINMLRRLGCSLPIQVWHLGADELDEKMASLLKILNVECIDALDVEKKHPIRILNGWELKPYAINHCPFQEVLYLDADNLPVVNPEFLFESKPYRETGAIFWPDYGQLKKTQTIWDSCGLDRPAGPEFESGQMLVDKERCWKALRLALWFNENSDFYYQHLHGDKETFHLAFKKLGQTFSMPQTPIHSLEGTMCQHDFAGNRLFQHRNGDKWNLSLRNKKVEDFWFEAECRSDLKRLKETWANESLPRLEHKPVTH